MALGSGKLEAALKAWCDAATSADPAAALAICAPAYTLSLPDAVEMTLEEELAFRRSDGDKVRNVRVIDLTETTPGRSALAVLEYDVRLEHGRAVTCRVEVDFERRDGEWRAARSRAFRPESFQPEVTLASRLAGWVSRVRPRRKRSESHLPFLPYLPGEDFALPRSVSPDPGGDLPVPPKELWLGYEYLAYGEAHVQKMFEIAESSGFRLRPGDRVLDFGCGAGRMIRHLRHLTPQCEVWGTDISSTHILWCRRHLSPPFRFATTTTVPHLPFADGSFRFIYCGSVFTHIDDMADAWLLELRRILAPDGRLYVTIHDNTTVETIETTPDHFLGWVRNRPAYRDHKHSFDVITVNRGSVSQVFYDRDYFARMAAQSFEVLSMTPGAYFYQTAVLLKPPSERA